MKWLPVASLLSLILCDAFIALSQAAFVSSNKLSIVNTVSKKQSQPQLSLQNKYFNPSLSSSAMAKISSDADEFSENGEGEANESEDSEFRQKEKEIPLTVRVQAGKLEELKQREAALSRLLAAIRREKLSALRSRPLTIGIVGFGRFGQFMARTFCKHGRVVATSRSDYSDLARGMGITYIPLSDPKRFLEEDLDVIVMATSILSFEETVSSFVPFLQDRLDTLRKLDEDDQQLQMADLIENSVVRGPLIVDVLSVKEHPRQVMLNVLPKECDILCTHPMFGPDSGKNGWHGLNFVYERTRIDGVVLDASQGRPFHQLSETDANSGDERAASFVAEGGEVHGVHENSEAHIEGMDRMERFLSIWEEEGCRMVQLSCKEHDTFAANSQFVTHLMGRILGEQGLTPTPIDTKGFESVLKLVGSTTADSFDLFYGLYKYNQNSLDTIVKLRNSMDVLVGKLKEMEAEDKDLPKWMFQRVTLTDSFRSDTVWCLDEKKENNTNYDNTPSEIDNTCQHHVKPRL